MQRESKPDNSGKLFDYIKEVKKFRYDTRLAELLDEHVSVISEIRHGHRKVNDKLLVKICDRTGISLKKARRLIFDL